MRMLENLLELLRMTTRNRRSSRRSVMRADLRSYYPANGRRIACQRRPGGSECCGQKARRMSASVRSLVATLSAVLADLCGSLGEKVRRNPPESEFVSTGSTWEGVRGLRDDGRVTTGDGPGSFDGLEGQGIPSSRGNRIRDRIGFPTQKRTHRRNVGRPASEDSPDRRKC